MEFATLVILFLYVLMILKYAFGWRRISQVSKQDSSFRVSVIIALRNEEEEIASLIASLQSQLYPADQLEFIFVDDHSTDRTLTLLEGANLENLHVINMPEEKFGKKNAISIGVSVAKGDIIIVSDADCIFTNHWVQKMASYFINDDVKLVSGPVSFKKQKGVFQSLQALEFTSLIGTGAGAIGVNDPIFCNGANMAYRKEVFLEVNNFEDDKLVSGDDVFLLHRIKKRYSSSIVFVKDTEAIVETNSVQSFREFINQRKRWTAKSVGYRDFSSIYASWLVLLTNCSFVFLFSMIFFDIFFIYFFIFFYIIKLIVDLCLLLPVLRFFNRKDLISLIFPFEFFYSYYIILIVFLSFTTRFEWKGRIHKK